MVHIYLHPGKTGLLLFLARKSGTQLFRARKYLYTAFEKRNTMFYNNLESVNTGSQIFRSQNCVKQFFSACKIGNWYL